MKSTRFVKYSNLCELHEICEVFEYLWSQRDLWGTRIFVNCTRFVTYAKMKCTRLVKSWSSVQTVCCVLRPCGPPRGLRPQLIFKWRSASTRFVKYSKISELNEICEVHEYLWTARDLWSTWKDLWTARDLWSHDRADDCVLRTPALRASARPAAATIL